MSIFITIEGTRPLIMQSDRLVDPLDPLTVALKRAAKDKDKATDKGQDKLARIEFAGCLYLDDNERVCIPQDNILRMLRDAAAREKLGKTVREQIVCTAESFVLEYDGPKDAEKLYEDRRFVFRKSVVNNGKTRVMRTRPRFPTGWRLVFGVDIEGERTIKQEDIERFARTAGPLGLGTWRPRYGGFRVVEVKKA
jgi:histone H3/H4